MTRAGPRPDGPRKAAVSLPNDRMDHEQSISFAPRYFSGPQLCTAVRSVLAAIDCVNPGQNAELPTGPEPPRGAGPTRSRLESNRPEIGQP